MAEISCMLIKQITGMFFTGNVWMLITDITNLFLTHITDVAYDNKVILITVMLITGMLITGMLITYYSGMLITYYSAMLITDFTGRFITGILITDGDVEKNVNIYI